MQAKDLKPHAKPKVNTTKTKRKKKHILESDTPFCQEISPKTKSLTRLTKRP